MADALGEQSPADDALIKRWLKSGDQEAATLLVERHTPALTRFLGSIARSEDVEELAQDTFIRAFGAIESFRSDSSFRTWLFTIGRRLVLDRRRATRRRGPHVSVEPGDAVTPFDALDGLVATETADRLRGVVEKLSPTQREVFMLRVVEGLSYRDIAEVAGTTEGAARVHYHNAMRAVKEMIGD
jgi:RNA polymerase sigma-70 factor, ECF subfamily